MRKKLFIVLTLLGLLNLMGCDKINDSPKTLTFEMDGVKYDFSNTARLFQNAKESYTMKGSKDDTISLMIVVPELSERLWTKSGSGLAATIYFRTTYASSWGEKSSYSVQIKEYDDSDDFIEGTFTANMGSISTSIGFASDYKEIKNGKFALTMEK